MFNPTEEQKLAIDKSGTDIIVSAGAGSGKTAVLTERVISKLKAGEDIDKLLILTFTNAAAKDMKERIRTAIQDNNLFEQLLKIDSSFITTFDSFSLSVVKKYHYLLNVDNDIEIGDDLIIKFKKQELLDNIFLKLYEESSPKFIKFIKDFTRKDDYSLKEIILEIDRKLDLKYDKEDYLNNYLNTYFKDDYIDKNINEYLLLLKRKQDKIKDNLKDLELIVDGDYYYSFYSLLKQLLNSNTYDEIKENLDISLPRLRKGMTDAKMYKDNITKSLKDLKTLTTFNSVEEIKSTILKTKNYSEIIIDILKELNNNLKIYKQENKLYNFLDIAKLAIKLVKKFQEVKEELKNSFSEILLDEYQDTSDLQELFIQEISNENVYMVGDIKQSIYRFRNANPNLFKEKYLNYEQNNGGIKIDLLDNFRSREEVLNNINFLFDDIMSLDLGGADYKKSHQMKFGNKTYNDYKNINQNYNMEIYNYNLDNKDFSKEEVEAFIVALDIKDKIENHYQVYDKKTKSLRNVTYDDFVILMDKSTDFMLYKKIFTYFKVNLTIIKDESISDSYDLFILKNILILLYKLKNKLIDKEFWYCYLSIGRSYLFSLNDNYLYEKIKSKDLKNDIILDICYEIINDIDKLPLSKLINLIILKFNFYEKLITVGNIEESIIRLDYLENLSNNLGFTYIEFIDYLKTLLDNNEKIDLSLNKEINNSVKIMTIHKSKGLEYPICYFPGLCSKFNEMDIKKRFFYNDKYGIVTPYIDNGIKQTIYATLFKEDFKKDNISEKIRLFYVALTRAKEKMIFITSLKEEEETEEISLDTKLKYTSFSSILNSLRSKLTHYIKDIEIDNLGLTKDYTKYQRNNNLNLEKVLPLKVEEINLETKKINKNKYSKNMISLLSIEEKEKLDLGTKLHCILEVINFKKKDLSFIEPMYIEYVNKFLNLEILDNINDAKIYKEYEFRYQKDNITYQGIIDLILEYSDYIDIIDYKLKNIEDLNYQKQLLGYKDYLKKITDKKVNIYLYSLIDGNIKKL